MQLTKHSSSELSDNMFNFNFNEHCTKPNPYQVNWVFNFRTDLRSQDYDFRGISVSAMQCFKPPSPLSSFYFWDGRIVWSLRMINRAKLVEQAVLLPKEETFVCCKESPRQKGFMLFIKVRGEEQNNNHIKDIFGILEILVAYQRILKRY